jgi:hypothetical protein
MTKQEAKYLSLLAKIEAVEKELDIELDGLDMAFNDFDAAQENIADAAQELRGIANSDVLRIADLPADIDHAMGAECDVESLNDAAVDFSETLDSVLILIKQYKKLDKKGYPKYRKNVDRRYDYLFQQFIDKATK